MAKHIFKLGSLGGLPFVTIDTDNKQIVIQEGLTKMNTITIPDNVQFGVETSLKGAKLSIRGSSGSEVASVEKIYNQELLEKCKGMITAISNDGNADVSAFAPPVNSDSGNIIKGFVVLGFIVVFLYFVFSGSEPLPKISQECLDSAMSDIKMYDLIKDSHAEVKNDTITLVLVVNAAINEKTAKSYGDNFLRMTKSFCSDGPSPSKIIGKSNYNYQIGIFNSAEKQLYYGAKSAGAESISW